MKDDNFFEVACASEGGNRVDGLLVYVKKKWKFEEHLKDPSIKKEIQEIADKIIDLVPGYSNRVAGYLFFEKHVCKVNPKTLAENFEISKHEIEQAREEAGMGAPNFNEEVCNALIRNDRMYEEFRPVFLDAMNNLTTGDNRYESCAGAYLVLNKTYLNIYQNEFKPMFDMPEQSLRKKIRKIGYNHGKDYIKQVHDEFYLNISGENIPGSLFKKLVTKDFKERSNSIRIIHKISRKYGAKAERVVGAIPADVWECEIKGESKKGKMPETIARHFDVPVKHITYVLKN